MLEVSHEKTGIAGTHVSSHGCATYLLKDFVTNRKSVLALKKTNQNTQEPKNERVLISTRQSNVRKASSLAKIELRVSYLDLCEGGSFSTAIFNSDIQLSIYSILCLIICLSVCRFVKGTVCPNFAHCFVFSILKSDNF